MAGSPMEALEGADAAVLVTEWPEFADLDWPDVAKRMANPLLVDGRNFLDRDAVTLPGWLTRRSDARAPRTPRWLSRRRSADVQALILAGGEGTRLRPLTYTVPKPVLPLAGRPHIAYVIDWLVGHGVDDVIVSCGFLADGIRRALAELQPQMSRSATRRSPTRAGPRARSASPRRCSATGSSSSTETSSATWT